MKQNKEPTRCTWCGDDLLYVAYHDTEWGVPLHDETLLFEALILDGAQAGLSWITILRKRENYRRAFDNFDLLKISRYGERDIARLLGDAGIVRNRLKVNAAVTNARACLELKDNGLTLDDYLWSFVDGRPVINRWRSIGDVPATSPVSDKLSKDLAKRGFKFVGSTICYAMMQAIGMVNDHLVSCHHHRELRGTRK